MTLTKTLYFNGFQSTPLVLDSGQHLGPITLAYETYGHLNHSKTNAILVCHALSGDAHAAFSHEEDPSYIGWWDTFIGPGKALDTDRYFVICSNVIGGCKGSTGPSSINPQTGEAYALSFPVITIHDMVRAQKALIDALEISSLKMVIGGSMGGMQAMSWAIQYPDMVQSCVPVACTSTLSPQALAFDVVGRNAITSSKDEKGLAIARMIGHITYLSDESMALKFGRKLQEKNDYGYDFSTDFQIESYLKYQGDKFIDRFDANSYLYITQAIDYFDLAKTYGSLEAAFSGVKAKFLVAAIRSDWLYKPQDSKTIVQALMRLHKPVTYIELDSPYGHDAFLMDHGVLSDAVSAFLEHFDD
jgi:homoserine O-acetyltransferase